MKVRDASVGGGGGGAVNMVMDPENSDLFDLVWDGPGVTCSSSESIESNICVFLRRSLDFVRSASVSWVSTSDVNCARMHFCRALL